ncbi:hypothetical protein [Streptomyces flaveolus]|uniref:hypothetical protein n=1 Tax=Streptomyces flaveolus TaxID=67297 RepID=UPI003701E199
MITEHARCSPSAIPAFAQKSLFLKPRSLQPPCPYRWTYTDPEDGQTDLTASRLPATEPDKRRGVLMLNPGGPGGSGLALPALLMAQGLPSGAAECYDVIGKNTRGIGHSTAVSCGFTTDRPYCRCRAAARCRKVTVALVPRPMRPVFVESHAAQRGCAAGRPRRWTGGGRTPLDGAARGGRGQIAAHALIRKNVMERHNEAPPNMIAFGLVMRRSRVRIPKAAPVKARSHSP